MNGLDGIVAVMVVLAALGGYRIGLLARAISWLGMAVGVAAGVRVAPRLLELLAPNSGDLPNVVALSIAAVVLLVGGLGGQTLGYHAGAHLPLPAAGRAVWRIDRVLGAFAAVLGIVVGAWFLLPVVDSLPNAGMFASNGSRFGRFAGDVLGPPPDAVHHLGAAVGGERWKELVADGGISLKDVQPPTAVALEMGVVAAAEAATVKIQGPACSQQMVGTGYQVAGGLLVTNAHVVAGVESIDVTFSNGMLTTSKLVAFDSKRDLAVLQPAELAGQPLDLADAEPGDQGAVLGHADGAELLPRPFEIILPRTVQVGDLYKPNDLRYTRKVFVVAANLRRGDSGAPLVDRQGRVVGTIFATAPDVEGVALASRISELNAVLEVARANVEQGYTVRTGPCAPRES